MNSLEKVFGKAVKQSNSSEELTLDALEFFMFSFHLASNFTSYKFI